MKYDLLHIQGKPYVLVPLHDYRDLAGSGGGDNLPDEVLDRITARAEHPIKILRQHHGMTQQALAKAASISRPYLTEIETGKKDGSIRALKAIAEVFGVSVGLVT